MATTPTAHAGAALAALTAKLAAARSEEIAFAERLAALEVELALNVARRDGMQTADSGLFAGSGAYRRGLLNQRIADLLELRASLIAERAKRRRVIDEMAQRKEAIGAALAVLRAKSEPLLAAAR